MKISEETLLIKSALRKSAIAHQPINYIQLEELVPGCTTTKRHHLTSALRMLLQTENMVFRCIPTVGYEAVTGSTAVHEVSHKREKKIYSQVEHWKQEWRTIDVSRLGEKGMKDYIVGSIKLSAQEVLHGTEFHNKVQAIASNSKSTAISYSKIAIEALKDVS